MADGASIESRRSELRRGHIPLLSADEQRKDHVGMGEPGGEGAIPT